MTSPRRPGRRGPAILTALAALLVMQSGYLAATSSPDPFYVGNVFLHHYGGLLLALLLVRPVWRALSGLRAEKSGAHAPGLLAFVFGIAMVLSAVALELFHNTTPNRWLLHLHIGCASGALLFTLWSAAVRARERAGSPAARTRNLLAGAALIGVAFLATGYVAQGRRAKLYAIDNPERPPITMDHEAMGGKDGPFFPSSAATSTGGRIPADFFMTSESCKRCHADIYEQWTGSAHHFSSFNNQWYRKSIEYMQEVNSVESSRWCAGCHDHAVLLNGMMDGPVSSFIDTQEAHTGIGCNSCHAVTHVKSTMGNGGFFLEYPPLHDLAVSDNPFLRWLHDKAVALDPGPHKDVFLKPFHREQTADFCSSCHKVHLDQPVNNYRWLRGFNEYDNWQASGVSGFGARSFYYPPEPRDCADCHMPLVASDDKGNIDGFVHHHGFPAANTAVPYANLDEKQLRTTIEFLQRNQVTVDIFAAGPARADENAAGRPEAEGPQLASTFAVGEEAAMAVGRGGAGAERELAPLFGPLDVSKVTVNRGEDMRVDVVVRTRGVGHFFPGGTIDAFD
ncbi:cytochrome c family protein, partial [bacterium]|nr:cytochrome c family protein [bacterium]